MKKQIDILTIVIICLACFINAKEIGGVYLAVSLTCFLTDLVFLWHERMLAYRARWFLSIVALAIIGFTFFRITWDNAVNVLMECFVLLIAVKWIERSKRRDYLQILVLCLFLMVGQAFFTFSMGYLTIIVVMFIMATSLLMLLTTMKDLEEIEDQEVQLVIKRLEGLSVPLKWIFGQSILFLVGTIPVAVLLFFVLPRTQTPFLEFLNRGVMGYGGFSDAVRLGDVEKIQETENIAFRALIPASSKQDMDKKNLELYWRGIVFDTFDGRSWKTSPNGIFEFHPKTAEILPEFTEQKIMLEPYGDKYVFCMDRPVAVMSKARIFSFSGHNVFFMDKPLTRRMEYVCYSMVTHALEFHEEEEDGQRYLEIPEDFSQPVRDLALNLASSSKSPEETIQRMLTYLRSSAFQYASSGLPLTDNPLEDFLFKHKRGNCEYFASALGVMLRIAKIPSRLVGGYYGGYVHPIGKYYLVFQKNAHVWVEALLEQKGSSGIPGRKLWVRVDPTPLPADGMARSLKFSWTFQVKLYLDLINYYWHQFIIQYNVETQIRVLKKSSQFFSTNPLGFLRTWASKIRSYEIIGTLTFVMVVVLVAISITAVIYSMRLHVKGSHYKILRLFERKMKKLGFARKPSESLMEFYQRTIPYLDNDYRQVMKNFLEVYSQCFYGAGKFRKEDLEYLKNLLKELKI